MCLFCINNLDDSVDGIKTYRYCVGCESSCDIVWCFNTNCLAKGKWWTDSLRSYQEMCFLCGSDWMTHLDYIYTNYHLTSQSLLRRSSGDAFCEGECSFGTSSAGMG